jgi:hypothetical protein
MTSYTNKIGTLAESDGFLSIKLEENLSPQSMLASAADFDIDELFQEQCGSSPASAATGALGLVAATDSSTRDLSTNTQKDLSPSPEFILHLPPLHSIKRPKLYNPPESEMPTLKRPKTYTKEIPSNSCSNSNKNNVNSFKKIVPDLLLPEDVVVGPIDDLVGSTALPAEASKALLAIKTMKEKMISTHTLLTTYTALRRTSAQSSSQLALTRTQLVDAARWRSLLADENARLKARVAIVGKEEEHLKCAVRKLTKDTNGLQKNEALKHEIVEKNREIERLLRKCEGL